MPKILENLVKKLSGKGKSKSSAYAIATNQLQKTGKLKSKTNKLTKTTKLKTK